MEVLFTTFTRELAQRVNLSPRYISKRADELNETLWRLAKSFFLRYNETNTDCVFVIDEEAKTVTLTGGGIRREVPVLCVVTGSGRTLSQGGCEAVLSLPVKDFAEEGSRSPHWLKRGGAPRELDKLVPVGALLERENKKLSPAQAEEMERMKLRCSGQKAALVRKLDALEVKVKALEAERDAVTGDRLKRLALEKEATKLKRELMRGRENQFFDAMRLDVELEKQVKQFAEQEKLTARSRRSS